MVTECLRVEESQRNVCVCVCVCASSARDQQLEQKAAIIQRRTKA